MACCRIKRTSTLETSIHVLIRPSCDFNLIGHFILPHWANYAKISPITPAQSVSNFIGTSILICAPANGSEPFPAEALAVLLGDTVNPNPERIAGPSPLVMEASGTVLEPIMIAELPKEMGTPDIVTGELPRCISVPPIEKPDGFTVKS